MQPLKRFTQCGSLTMLFAIFIVLFGVSSTALTTFGKPPSNIPPATPPPPPRECTTQNDCAALESTSCVKLFADTPKCLCGDNLPPVNGFCQPTEKALHHMCRDSTDCEENLICVMENSTKPAATYSGFGSQRAPQPSNVKVCECDVENGSVENPRDGTCSGAVTIFTGVFVPIFSLIFGSILARK